MQQLKRKLDEAIRQEFLRDLHIKTHYQPIVDLRSGKVVGFEALSRFHLGDKDMPPLKVFSIAQDMNFLEELKILCRKYALERFPYKDQYVLFLNVLPSYLTSNKFGKGITYSLVRAVGLEPTTVALEITESQKVEKVGILIEALTYYKNLGFKVGLDDVGTGYNSLSLLLELEGLLDFIKLPRELISGISRSKIRRSIAKVLTDIANSTGAQITYEGVEKEEDLKVVVSELPVGLAQGFYFSKPIEAERLSEIAGKVYTLPFGNYNHLDYLQLQRLSLKREDKLYKFIEWLNKVVDRYVVLDLEGKEYLVDVWKLKTNLQPMQIDLYYYKPVEEFICKLKEMFIEVSQLPRISVEYSSSEYLLNLVKTSHYDVFALVSDERVYFVERHQLIDKVLSKISEELLNKNPLTRLPGNKLIEIHVKNLLSLNKDFWFCYIDIDNFKAFNDTYGFYLGDQLIKKVGFILGHFQEEEEGVFVGHIGGDDFVLVLEDWHRERVIEKLSALLKRLKEELTQFFNPEDIRRGYFIGRDREGNLKPFPIASISMVAFKGGGTLQDIAQKSAKLKKKAKSEEGSVLLVEDLNQILTIGL